jgi:uncharacterized protein (TIGR00725 family)
MVSPAAARVTGRAAPAVYPAARKPAAEPAKEAAMPFQVAVCGPGECTGEEARSARRVGELLAARGAVVICGGGGGVMAAVAAGVRAGGGIVIGIRPDGGRDGASADLSAVVVTNMGQARNAVIVWSADAVIIVGGSWGTLSELALAKRRGGVPVISLGGWQLRDRDGAAIGGVEHVRTAAEAVQRAMQAAGR